MSQQTAQAHVNVAIDFTWNLGLPPIAAPCALTATATPGMCDTVSNLYSVTGTISLTSAVAGTATITDGDKSTTVTVTANDISVAYSLTGLVSDGVGHFLTVSLPGCGTATTAYTAPASCSVAPVCSINAVATVGLCQIGSNTYSSTVVVTINNPVTGDITISDEGQTQTVSTTASTPNTFTMVFPGLIANGTTHTLTISLLGCSTASTTYTAPASCSAAPVCSLSATATAGLCSTATNTYSASVVVDLTNAPAGTLTVSIPGSAPVSQTIVANTMSFTAVLTGLSSDGTSHIATISLPGCGTTTASFIAPTACYVSHACAISAVATAGLCQPATNTFTALVVVTLTNPTAGVLTVTDGPASQTFATTAVGSATFTASFTWPSNSLAAAHVVLVTLPGCSTAIQTSYTEPTSCSLAPICSISATATAGLCATATNTYSRTVLVTMTNPTAGTLVVSDGVNSSPFVILASGGTLTTSAVFSGLLSDGATHTVTVSLPGCGMVTTTYTAPASCSMAPQCTLSLTASGANCNPTTNLYVLSGAITLTNSPTSQTLTLTDGSYVRSLTVNAGTTSINFNETVLPSDGALHTVTLTSSATACGTITTTYTAPASCSAAPVCSLSATATPGLCATATNTFSTTVVVNIKNVTTAGTLTITNGDKSLTFATTVAGSASFNAVFAGLVSDGTTHTITVSLPGCSTTTTNYTAPGSCTQPTGTKLSLAKLVNKSKAKIGDVLTYTLVLSNVGTTIATNVLVKDSVSTGLVYVTNSATTPTGTTFTQGIPVSTWAVSSISAGQSLSMTFQAIADSSGILYDKATIPGDTAVVCISVPVIVCTGDTYLFQLTVAPGRSSYKWFKDNVEIVGQTTNVLNVTAPGIYSLAVDNVSGSCPDFSCCPFIVEEDTLPTFAAMAIPVTCVGSTPQTNGKIVLRGFNEVYTYQYSSGATFNQLASISGLARVIPANGIVAGNLPNPSVTHPYTIRVYNSSGCYTDVTVLLEPTVCGCPADVCIPFIISQTKRAKRIGDAR